VEESSRLRNRLLAAVRSGHGLGTAVWLSIGSGPHPTIDLGAAEPHGTRWLARSLLPAYRTHEWVRAPERPSGSVAQVWTARRLDLPGEHPSTSAQPTLVIATVLAGFATLRSGVTLDLFASPVPSARRAGKWTQFAPSSTLPRPEPGPRSAARRNPTILPDLPRAEAESLWAASVVLRTPIGIAPRPVVRLVEDAWRSLDGVGLRLRRHAVRPGTFLLSERELAALLPTWEVGGTLRIGAEPQGGLPVGRLGSGEVLALPVPSGEGRHVAVVGETGMGKSSLLVAFATRAAGLGSVILLDPLGETAAELREELAARGRSVEWVGPDDPASGINALGGNVPYDPGPATERRVRDLVRALERIRSGRFRDGGFWGPRLEEMLGEALRAASSLPQGTVADAHALLATGARAGRGSLRSLPLPVVRLAERIAQRPDDAEGARRLLYEVAGDPTLVGLLCDRTSGRTVEALVRRGRTFVVAGLAASVGESTARYLLAVYLALLWPALLARGRAEKTFVVLDEAQWYAHGSLAEMLRLGRRCNVHVVLATQSFASLPDDVREAARTNVADIVAFRGSPEDARDLERIAPGFVAEHLLALPRGSALVMVGKGERAAWVRTTHLPRDARPPPVPSRSYEGLTHCTGADLAGTGPGTSVAAPTGPDDTAGESRSTDDLWAELLERARTTERRDRLQIFVPLVARGTGPRSIPSAWRTVGSRLGRVGALVESVRLPDGLRWEVDPSCLLANAASTPPASSDGTTTLPTSSESSAAVAAAAPRNDRTAEAPARQLS
jgi:DNA helicase HerA-like ATPase